MTDTATVLNDADDILHTSKVMLESINVGGMKLAGAFLQGDLFHSIGGRLAVSIFVIMVCVTIIKMLLGEDGAIAKITGLAMQLMMVLALFSVWAGVADYATELPNYLAGEVTTYMSKTPDSTGCVQASAEGMEYMISTMTCAMGDVYDAATKPAGGGAFKHFLTIVAPGTAIVTGDNPSTAVGSLVSGILTTIVGLITMGFMLFTLVKLIFLIVAGQVMIYVGLCLGPLILPWIMVKQTETIATGWFRFMVGAAFYKVIGMIVGILVWGVISAIAKYAHLFASADDSSVFMYLIILFFSVLGYQLMSKADNMASDLIGGTHTGDGGGGVFGMIMKGSGAVKASAKKDDKKGPRSESLKQSADKNSSKNVSSSSAGNTGGASTVVGAATSAATGGAPAAVQAVASVMSATRVKMAAARSKSGRS